MQCSFVHDELTIASANPAPKEYNKHGKLWQLMKCVYGLSDASLCWYKRVKEVMVEAGAKISKVDPAVFYWSDEQGKLKGVLASHVDDFLWAGTSEFESTVVSVIRSKFCVGKEDSVAFQYLGLELLSDDSGIYLQQNQYVDSLTFIEVQKHRALQKDSLLTKSEKHSLRSKVGQILWIARQSRPDVIFDACVLACAAKGATVKDLAEVNKLIKRIKCDKTRLTFQHLGNNPFLVVFSDASMGNMQNGGTQGGQLILLVGDDGKFSPIGWSSRRIRRVVRSTLAGETLAMADGIDDGIFFSTLFTELTLGLPDPNLMPLVCVTDCKSLFEAIKSTKFVAEKRLRLEISGIKELMDNKVIKNIYWCETTKQLADCLTKRGASPFKLMDILDKGFLSGYGNMPAVMKE